MALSEEVKQNWLSTDNFRVVLLDIQYHDGSSKNVLRISNYPYVMPKGDSTVDPIDGSTVISNLLYNDIVLSIPNIVSSIDDSDTIGSITILNPSGEYDDFLDYSFVGHRINISIGDQNWPRDDFISVFDGIIQDISSSTTSEIVLDIKNRKDVLDVELEADLISQEYWDNLMTDVDNSSSIGSGSIQGLIAYDKSKAVFPEEVEDTHRPICLGKVFNISPVLIDSYNHVYLIHEGEITEVSEVRSNGIPLAPPGTKLITCSSVSADFNQDESFTATPSGATGDIFKYVDTGSSTATIYYTPTSGIVTNSDTITGGTSLSTASVDTNPVDGNQYEVDIDLGGNTGAAALRLLDHDQGTQITCDIIGTTIRPSSVTTGSLSLEDHSLAFILEWLILNESEVSFAEICQETFPPTGSRGFDNSSEMGIFYKNEQNLLQVLTELSNSLGGYLRFSSVGCKLQLLKFKDPELETVDLYLENDDVIKNGLSIQSIEDPRKSISLGFKKNWTPQDDGTLAGSITDVTSPNYDINKLSAYKNEFSTSIIKLGLDHEQYPLATHIEMIETTLWDSADAVTELVRRKNLRNTKRKVFYIQTAASSFTYDIGDIVNISYPRYNLDDGINALIIGKEESLTSNKVNLTVWL